MTKHQEKLSEISQKQSRRTHSRTMADGDNISRSVTGTLSFVWIQHETFWPATGNQYKHDVICYSLAVCRREAIPSCFTLWNMESGDLNKHVHSTLNRANWPFSYFISFMDKLKRNNQYMRKWCDVIGYLQTLKYP